MWIPKLCKYANPQDCGLSQAGRYVEQHGASQALSCEAIQMHRSVEAHGPVASCASTVCGSMQVHEKGAPQIFACSGITQNCIECGDSQTHTLPTLGTTVRYPDIAEDVGATSDRLACITSCTAHTSADVFHASTACQQAFGFAASF